MSRKVDKYNERVKCNILSANKMKKEITILYVATKKWLT